MKKIIYACILISTWYNASVCTEKTVEQEQVELLRMPSAEQWSNCAQTLQSYQQEYRGFFNKLGSLINNYTYHTSVISIALLLAFFAIKFNKYVDFDGARFIIAASGTCYALCAAGNRMLEWLGRRMESKAQEDFYALESFIRNWEQHQESTPFILHNLFNELAHDYAMHQKINLTPEQAEKIVEQIIQTGELGQSMTEALSLNFKRSDDENLVGIVPFFLATRINIGLNLNDCIFQCAGDSQHKVNRNQWEYIARQLGIIKQASFLESVAQFANNYQWPLSFGVGMPAGFFTGVKLSNYLTHDYNYLPLGRALGTTGGVAAFSFLFKLLIKAGSDNQWRSTHLLKFVLNWKGQKHNTPSCLHTLFDQLHRLYLKNHRSLQLDPLFVDELYQIILEAWMMSMVPLDQASPETVHDNANGTNQGNMTKVNGDTSNVIKK